MATDENTLLRGARSIALVGMVFLTVGTCGVGNATTALSSSIPDVSSMTWATETNVDVARAAGATRQAVADVLMGTASRRWLDVANMVLSALLVIASVTLLTRKSTAAWWGMQAAIGNILWTLTDGGAMAFALIQNSQRLTALVNAELAARAAALATPGPASSLEFPSGLFVAGYALAIGVMTVLRTLVFFWAILRLRRPEVQAFLAMAPPPAPRE